MALVRTLSLSLSLTRTLNLTLTLTLTLTRWLEPGAAIGGGWAPVGNVGLHAAFGKVSLGKVHLGRVNPSLVIQS